MKAAKTTDNIFVYHNVLDKKILNKYDELKKNIINNNENKIILSTGSYIRKGLDDSSLGALFLTMPISSITKVKQYTGRIHRRNKDKKEIIVEEEF